MIIQLVHLHVVPMRATETQKQCLKEYNLILEANKAARDEIGRRTYLLQADGSLVFIPSLLAENIRKWTHPIYFSLDIRVGYGDNRTHLAALQEVLNAQESVEQNRRTLGNWQCDVHHHESPVCFEQLRMKYHGGLYFTGRLRRPKKPLFIGLRRFIGRELQAIPVRPAF